MKRLPGAARSVAKALALALALGGLAACDGLRESFGLLRTSPDEFNVVARAPLAIPASLDRLPPPRADLARSRQLQPAARARAALVGQRVGQSLAPGAASPGEELLAAAAIATALAGSDADSLDPAIRQTLESDRQRILDDIGWLEEINPFRRRPDPTELPLDVARERARLQSNAALGLAPHVGDLEGTIAVQEDKALLEDLF